MRASEEHQFLRRSLTLTIVGPHPKFLPCRSMRHWPVGSLRCRVRQFELLGSNQLAILITVARGSHDPCRNGNQAVWVFEVICNRPQCAPLGRHAPFIQTAPNVVAQSPIPGPAPDATVSRPTTQRFPQRRHQGIAPGRCRVDSAGVVT